MGSLPLEQARRIFGDRLVDPAAAAALLGSAPAGGSSSLPFTTAEAESARDSGCLLVYRPERAADGVAITLAHLLERVGCGSASGFQGDDPWFAERSFATSETIEPGWALVHAEPRRETLNRTYDRATTALRELSGGLPWRRRRAVEIAYDVFVVAAARNLRLLENAWDWSSTPAGDGGLVNVGGFASKGLEVLSYSPAVKHGALGICPTLVRTDAR